MKLEFSAKPSRIECVDDDGSSVFVVTPLPGGGASIHLAPTTSKTMTLDQIAPLIRQALVDLRLVSDEDAT